jgi:hypothetical protein
MSNTYGDEPRGGAVSELRRIREELRSEAARINVQGHALSEDEAGRATALESAGFLVEQAIGMLTGSGIEEI